MQQLLTILCLLSSFAWPSYAFAGITPEQQKACAQRFVDWANGSSVQAFTHLGKATQVKIDCKVESQYAECTTTQQHAPAHFKWNNRKYFDRIDTTAQGAAMTEKVVFSDFALVCNQLGAKFNCSFYR